MGRSRGRAGGRQEGGGGAERDVEGSGGGEVDGKTIVKYLLRSRVTDWSDGVHGP